MSGKKESLLSLQSIARLARVPFTTARRLRDREVWTPDLVIEGKAFFFRRRVGYLTQLARLQHN